ncbi:MATE family efflux transporter [Oryzomonas japonica]|uniref:MATE family efflux transporter n=1 Tax=Oryzomonas japonica TaxID=2603858 RepID=A0A7J4ZPK9_9BACT|nr:MATE family efflux transporter [Oryzomonas japonica]KAB0664795.1 MATE family efflux transporter [Oryzomonas japonica]
MTTDLTTAPIPALIRRLAIPSGIGFFFNTMFNVVDTWYAGRLSTTALAAMSLCFPVFFIILAVGAGISTGATTLIGNALGRGRRDEAQCFVLQALSFALVHAVILTSLGLVFAPRIFIFMGAQGEYLSLALGYMNVTLGGAIFSMLNFVMSAILNSHGNTATYRNFLVTAFFLNLVLDPWFMYGGLGVPTMGLPGIALATISTQCLGNFYLFSRLLRLGFLPTFTLRELWPRRQYYGELMKQGFPSALNMMTVTVGIFIITWFAGRFGKEVVAAYGIGTRVEQLALLPIMGLNVSTLALTAQNFGAGNLKRIRHVLALSLRYGFILAAIGTVLVLAFSTELMSAFSRDGAVINAGVRYLGIEAFVFPAYVLLYVCVSAMQGVKRPGFALLIGLYRQIAAPALAFPLLAIMLGWGVMGIWWGIFITTWSAAVIVVIYVTWIVNKLEKDTLPA